MKIHAIALSSLLISLSAQADNNTLPEAVKNLKKQGIDIIKPFNAPGGVQGWLGKYQDTGLTLYLTPDKKHVISGYMYDEKGNNLSEKVINDEIYIPAGREMWKTLTKAPGIKTGNEQASCHVVVFADPFCHYCTTFWQAAQPWIKQNSISLKTLLVGIIKPDSGRYAAAILASHDPAKTWQDFESANGNITLPMPENTPLPIFAQIQYNQELMEKPGVNATPAIYYLNKENTLQQIIGSPNEKQMADLVACR